MNKYKEVYILGIGGSGMSSIAKYLVQQNINVAGYDQRKSFITNQLNQDGIKDVHVIGHDSAFCINDLGTSYINDGNGNLSYFKERNNYLGTFGCELSSHFFNFDNKRYRLFTFKEKFKNGVSDTDQVYLGLEYLGKNIISNK